MADDRKRNGSGGADEFRALSEARTALEAVELEHGRMDRDRRRLRDRLDGLLGTLRDGAVLLLFDAEGELAGAEGAFDEHLGASLSDLVERFEDFAGEDTRRALDEANQQVMALDSSGVAVSRSFLHSDDEQVGFAWLHVRRHDDDEKLIGTEVIGMAPPVPVVDDDSADAEDPFESLLRQFGGRMLDDSDEATIQRSIEAFGDLFSVDRVVVNRYDEGKREFSIMSSWLRGDTEPLKAESRGISISELPWAYSLLGAGETVAISEKSELPSEARDEKRIYAQDGVRSSLLVPIARSDRLFGFVSMQCARQQRDWSAADLAHAAGFVRILSGTLARRELEDELAEVRREAEAAVELAESAESEREQANSRAKEADKKLDALNTDADKARRRIEDLEKEVEKAHEAESEARTAADEQRDRAEAVRKEVEKEREKAEKGLKKALEEAEEGRKKADAAREETRKEAEKVRRDLEAAKSDAERTRRRADDAESEAVSVRKEFDEAQRQVEEALRDATSARAELRGLHEADDAAAEVVRQATTKLAALDNFDAETTVELHGGTPGRGFDPDATLEMEFSSLVAQRQSGAGELAAKASEIAELDDPEATIEFPPRDRVDDKDKDASTAFELEEMLEKTQIEERLREATEEFGDAPWGSGSADNALPSLLRDDRGRDDDLDEDDFEEHDFDEDDRDDDRPSVADPDGGDDVDRDVEAARAMARRAAGTDAGKRRGDWWGVAAGGDDRDDGSDRDASEEDREDDELRLADEGPADGDDDEVSLADEGPADGDDDEVSLHDDVDEDAREDEDADGAARDDEDDDEDDAIVFETAWDAQDSDVDDLAELDTAPPADRFDLDRDRPEEGFGVTTDDEVVEEQVETVVAVSEIEGVDAEIGLQDVGGNEELYRSLLTKFRNDYIGAGAKIDAAIEKGNIEVAHLLLHAIKGVSGILGAVRVHGTADELESRLIGNDPTATRSAVDGFTVALDEVLASIGKLDGVQEAEVYAPELSSVETWDHETEGDVVEGVSDPMVLRSYLSGLRQHLLAEKPRQCRLVMGEINARKWPQSLNEKIEDLDTSINDGSFEAARVSFEELMEMLELG